MSYKGKCPACSDGKTYTVDGYSMGTCSICQGTHYLDTDNCRSCLGEGTKYAPHSHQKYKCEKCYGTGKKLN